MIRTWQGILVMACWALLTSIVSAQSAAMFKPLRLTALSNGNVFVWNYAVLQSCAADGKCRPVQLPKPKIRDMRVGSADSVFVLAETTISTEKSTKFDQSVFLVDVNGGVLDRWDMPEGVTDFTVEKGHAYALSGDRVFKLEARGARTLLAQARPRDERLFVDKLGKLILCSPSDVSEAIHPGVDKRASCFSQAGWRFDGLWYHVAPLACGDWLIEPSVSGTAAIKTTLLRVRSLQNGQLVATVRLAIEELRCVNGALLYDVTGERTLPLPGLKPGKKVTCGGARVRDVAETQPGQACLNTRGEVSSLGSGRRLSK